MMSRDETLEIGRRQARVIEDQADTIARLTAEVEKLKKYESGESYDDGYRAGVETGRQEALGDYETIRGLLSDACRERDEARAEAERLREEAKPAMTHEEFKKQNPHTWMMYGCGLDPSDYDTSEEIEAAKASALAAQPASDGEGV